MVPRFHGSRVRYTPRYKVHGQDSGVRAVHSRIPSDGRKMWGDLHDKILFKNLPNLISLLEKLLNDKKYCSTILEKIYNNFINSDKSIEKSLDKVLNIHNEIETS